MAKINLLPWREELREQKKRLFAAIWGGTVVIAGAIIFVGDMLINDWVVSQQQRNQYLQREIKVLDKKIKEIKNIKEKKAMLLERMAVINGLQGNRPVIVRIFDQLVQIVPEGVYFKTLSISGESVSLVGVAESNNRVAAIMRNIDASAWFSDPNLTAVRKITEDGERLNEFNLTFQKTSPDKEDDV